MLEHICPDKDQRVVRLLDQRKLPEKEVFVLCRNAADMVHAIQQMVVRGAPAIGVSAAWGCWLEAARLSHEGCPQEWEERMQMALALLKQARPTAVNLAWSINRMYAVWHRHKPKTVQDLTVIWEQEAQTIMQEDVAANRTMGALGATLLHDGDTVLTHCNAGALATAGFGTALGVIYAAVEQGKRITVLADETRPLFQGSRLTAYELQRNNIPVRVLCDNASAFVMSQGQVQAVITGADRIAINGDVVNKIGTLGVAVSAQHFGIPFYVVAPLSTFDPTIARGEDILIEVRGADEVAYPGLGMTDRKPPCVLPVGVEALNFAFDVTPGALISAIITEKGILWPPYGESIQSLL